MSRESKNLHQARAYVRQAKPNCDAELLINSIRNDIPNCRLMHYKYLWGIARMLLNGEITTGADIADINRYLEYIASDAHFKEYDKNFNGESLETLSKRFKEVISISVCDDMEKIEKLSLGERNHSYAIVPIPDYNTAKKYSDFTQWCITHYEDMYKSYTNDGLGLFYFCLKNGYDKMEAVHNGPSALDDYGLSMIAVSVRNDGSMNTCTCRWNHKNGGNDSIMSTEELSKLLGVNFYKAFPKPKFPEEAKKVKVVLDDYTIITVGNFNPRAMTALAVNVCGDKYITLNDCKTGAVDIFNWDGAMEIVKEKCSKTYLPSKNDWQKYFDNKKVINSAILAVGGTLLHRWSDYWASTEKSITHAWHMSTYSSGLYDSFNKTHQLHVRAFLSV